MKKVVITGAPGTGKTVIINALEVKGYQCFHEIIRAMTAKTRSEGTSKKQVSNPLAFVDDPYTFNQRLLEGRLADFKASEKTKKTVSFFDRGMPDVLAYMNYFNQPYNKDFKKICRKNTYNKIFILPPWKEIYRRDNERLETFDQAEQLHEQLLKSYQEFGYAPILVPKTSIHNRISFILKELKNS